MGFAATVAHYQVRDIQLRTHADHSQCDAHWVRSLERLCKKCEGRDLRKIYQGIHGCRADADSQTIAELSETASSCDFCSFVLRIIQTTSNLGNKLLDPKDQLTLRVAGTGTSFPCERCTDPVAFPEICRLSLQLLRPSSTLNCGSIQPYIPPFHELKRFPWYHARPVLDTVEPMLLRSWLNSCDRSHQYSICQPNQWSQPMGVPFRLVDVKRKCIIEPQEPDRYAALSYVWGHAKPFTLNTKTYELFKTEGGISTSPEPMPRGFEDAIRLTELLGLDYIWIDALCIRQDDPDDLKSQLRVMHTIYSCAYVTIVSDTASICESIPGVSPASRIVVQNVLVTEALSLAESRPTRVQAMEVSPWERRGWTLQEKHFSKRLLILSQAQTFYECGLENASEDTFSPHDILSRPLDPSYDCYIKCSLAFRQRARGSERPIRLLDFRSLLQDYLTRGLSYEEDIIRAFEGVLNSVAPSLGYHTWGIPSKRFHELMLWTYHHHDPLQRRAGFPSWSWAGHKSGGALSFVDSLAMLVDVTSEVHWHRCHVLSSSSWDLQILPSSVTSTDTTLPLAHPEAQKGYTASPDQSPSSALPKAILPAHVPKELHDHLLWFRTSSTTLYIDHILIGLEGVTDYELARIAPQNAACGLFAVRLMATSNVMGRIVLNKEWRVRQFDSKEFIVVGHGVSNFRLAEAADEAGRYVFIMLIERRGHVAFRVQLCTDAIKLTDWSQAQPEEKWILMA